MLSLDDLLVHCAVTEHFVKKYRHGNKHIAALWKAMGNLLPWLAANNDSGSKEFGPGWCLTADVGKIVLPDGSYIRYPDLIKDGDGYSYAGRKGIRMHIYGGLLTENIVQALARIIVFKQIIDSGAKVVLTTHDEGVFCVPTNTAPTVLAAVLQQFSTPPFWCPTLPLAAEGGYGESYGLAK
jgi:hypothetical protein